MFLIVHLLALLNLFHLLIYKECSKKYLGVFFFLDALLHKKTTTKKTVQRDGKVQTCFEKLNNFLHDAADYGMMLEFCGQRHSSECTPN